MALLPRASWRDVLRGDAPLVGSRLDQAAPRGLVSPVEARVGLGVPYGDLQEEERRRLARRGLRPTLVALVGAALAASLPRAEASTSHRPFVVSAYLDGLTIERAIAELTTPPPDGRTRFFFFAHAHALNLAASDPDYRRVLCDADRVLPDGVGIRIGSALLGTPLPHNLNGTDLLPLLCDEAARRALPLVLVGAAPGVAQACADALRGAHPSLAIPVVEHGFVAERDVPALVVRIRDVGPCVVLVGMGSPNQERWALRWLSGLHGATVLTVGGLFDFYSGRMPRAPIFLREAGLEWAFRWAQEPRRMTRRYALGNPLFLARVALQRARQTRPDRPTTERPEHLEGLAPLPPDTRPARDPRRPPR
jgi:N-acetylglucosaminyldiphosphoundecaprenol N-acetyl-beta-D-mannosaminyltransferase